MESCCDRPDHQLEEKMAELTAIREELHRAKDNAMQSWLDSKPLIDELEKLQAGLATAKNRTSMSNIVISELKSQLETTQLEIRTKMEEETKAKELINEINQVLDQKYKESEQIKLDIGEERRSRSKLKQVLRMRRQRLRRFHLTLQAVKIESETLVVSKNEAVAYIQISETDNSVVRIGQGEFYELKSELKEKTGLAEWKISKALEQKLEAEETRDFAVSRLKEIRRRRRMKEEMVKEEIEEEQGPVRVEEKLRNGSDYSKGREEAVAKANRRKPRKKTRRRSKKKKASFFSWIGRFLCSRFRSFV